MCDFGISAIIASTAIAGAASAVTYESQRKSASQQSDYQNKMYSQTGEAANENYNSTLNQINYRQDQEKSQFGIPAVENAVAADQARASAVVQAAGAGIEGNSVDVLMGDFSRIEATNRMNLDTQRRWSQEQSYQDALSAQANAKNQIASATPGPVQYPSQLGLALQIGSTALGGYSNTLSYNNQRRAKLASS